MWWLPPREWDIQPLIGTAPTCMCHTLFYWYNPIGFWLFVLVLSSQFWIPHKPQPCRITPVMIHHLVFWALLSWNWRQKYEVFAASADKLERWRRKPLRKGSKKTWRRGINWKGWWLSRKWAAWTSFTTVSESHRASFPISLVWFHFSSLVYA